MSSTVRGFAVVAAIGFVCMATLMAFGYIVNPSHREISSDFILGYIACFLTFFGGAIVTLLMLIIDNLRRIESAIWNKQPVIIQKRVSASEQDRE